MKVRDVFCASPASTAICSSLDHRSMIHHGTRPIDRRSCSKSNYAPASSSQQPTSPCSPYNYEKMISRKSSGKQRDSYRKSSAGHEDSTKSVIIRSVKQSDLRRNISADICDLPSRPAPPGSSSRYLLSDNTAPYIDWISESDIHHEVVPATVPSTKQHAKLIRHTNRNSSIDFPPRGSSSLGCSRDRVSEVDNVSENGFNNGHMIISSNDSPALTSSSSTHSRHQVVILRVSIHCKGCERKVKKHISKMEGVISSSIDLATKRVTIIGDVTPLGVLTSISKVKKAQLWPSATTSSPSPSPSSFPRCST